MRAPVIPAFWPYRDASRHIACKPHLWHVQDIGAGPLVLLLHGAGGATNSFRHLIPLLAQHYRIIALDLPGQGFSVLGARSRCGLDPVSDDIAALIRQEGWQPLAIIGHSAGGAIAQRLAELKPIKAVIGINSALGAFEGLEGWLFPVMAKALDVYGEETIVDAQGVAHSWRKDLAGRIVAIQKKADGSWLNENSPRWYEGNPILATSYALLTLGSCVRGQ